MSEYIDWQALERKRIAEQKRTIEVAIGELRSKVAMLLELERTEAWKVYADLIRNTATAKQQAAMKANDPSTLAREFGYMAACLDAVAMPQNMAQHLEAQLQSLATQDQS